MILQKIIAGIMAVFLGITGIFSANQRVSYLEERVNELEFQLEMTSEELMESESVILGAFYPLGGKRYKLAGSGVGVTDTSVELQSLTMPISGRELAMTDFGEVGYATMDPGNPSKKEFISFTGITQSGSSDKATLTGVSRGLSFVTPYSASTTLRSSHSGGSSLIFSNSPAFYSEFAIKRNDQDITGTWTFDSDALPEVDDSTYTPTDNAQIIWKKYADDLTNAGAADATTTVKGIVEIATITDTIKGRLASSSDTTAQLVVPAKYFATTTNSTTSVVLTDTDG
ncbi:MAG: hypothetical protein U9N86_18230, partial [Bacteroidota bacterium]|nr:hypothetical protein [Bacteroidota bacterium]